MTARTNLLSGTYVIEFTHMVKGPAAGLMLADLGTDRIELAVSYE